MNAGLFQSQVEESVKVFKTLEMFQGRIYSPRYPEGLASACRGKSYREIYEYLYKNQHYDMQLHDNSLVQYRKGRLFPNDLSYAYYESPFQTLTFAEFLEENVGIIDSDEREEYRPEYEDYLSTCPLKESITPIRYDFAPHQYHEGLHPASHLHFGHETEIRVGTKKILSPLSFTIFLIRQHYPDRYTVLKAQPEAVNWTKKVRADLVNVAGSYMKNWDDMEMYLV